MYKKISLIMLFILLTFVVSTEALSEVEGGKTESGKVKDVCSCKNFLSQASSSKDIMGASYAVFSGRIQKIAPITERHYGVSFLVYDSWKSIMSDSWTLVFDSSVHDCGVKLQTGWEYLVYVSRVQSAKANDVSQVNAGISIKNLFRKNASTESNDESVISAPLILNRCNSLTKNLNSVTDHEISTLGREIYTGYKKHYKLCATPKSSKKGSDGGK